MDEFEDIRPYRDDEVPAIVARLIDDDELTNFLSRYYAPRLSKLLPGPMRFIARREVKKILGDVSNIRDFQKQMGHFARRLVNETMTSFTYDGLENLSPDKPYVYMSNHRDIAGDSMLVDYILHTNDIDTVCIAVGDNLVQRQFVTDLMKLNKSFFIKRSVSGAKKMYAALLTSSRFVQQMLSENQSIWIAQAEGRAKDALDQTDPAVIKMLTLANRKLPLDEAIRQLGIVPVSISYEYDPCDTVKARELAAIARNGRYEKPPGEDLVSLARGLGGFKGRVHVSFGKLVDDAFETAEQVAHAVDEQVLGHLRVYPVNVAALYRLRESGTYSETWNETERILQEENIRIDPIIESRGFTERLNMCPEEHQPYWLAMYANPILNRVRRGLLPVSTANDSFALK